MVWKAREQQSEKVWEPLYWSDVTVIEPTNCSFYINSSFCAYGNRIIYSLCRTYGLHFSVVSLVVDYADKLVSWAHSLSSNPQKSFAQ